MKKKLSEKKRKWIERTVANDRSYKLFLYNRFFTFCQVKNTIFEKKFAKSRKYSRKT